MPRSHASLFDKGEVSRSDGGDKKFGNQNGQSLSLPYGSQLPLHKGAKERNSRFTPKKNASVRKASFLEQVTRVSPLAARPAKQHTVLFVLPWSVAEKDSDRAKCSLSLAAPPSTLASSRFTPKKNASVRKASFLEQVTRVELAGISLGS